MHKCHLVSFFFWCHNSTCFFYNVTCLLYEILLWILWNSAKKSRWNKSNLTFCRSMRSFCVDCNILKTWFLYDFFIFYFFIDIAAALFTKRVRGSEHITQTHLTSCVLSSRTLCSAGVRGIRQEVKGGPWEGLWLPLMSLLGRVRAWPRLSSCWVRWKVTVLPPRPLPSAPRRRTYTPPRTTSLQIISDAKK